MTQRIDHVVIHVEEALDQAQQAYTRLGFALTPRGHHSKGSSNHLAIFGDDYLELLGVEPQRSSFRWGHPGGLAGLVFKTSDADHTWRHLAERSIPLEEGGPQSFHRPVVVDGQHLGDARFRTLRIAASRIPNGRVFFCEHGTPELVWRKEWQQHPNGATGLAEYVYLALDPSAAQSILTQAFGAQTLTRHPHGVRFQAGPTAIWYLTREGVAQHYGVDVGLVPHGIERAVGLTLRVPSLQATKTYLAGQAIEGLQENAGKLVVPPSQTHGVILGFSAD
ncbi:VOC family protein [Herbaspirillum sp. AP02]|uniref:VOC family protein n=1 Tax=unclassified Herbaspirillum TaxID=2624150 RepID=UPI0018CB47D9|nr:VOC family protein [Herbaspirillum sp. AP02]MBG7618058.1 VOC family protein [Herbaspirillum sp. AP02]